MKAETIKAEAKSVVAQVIEYRRHIHKYAELSFEEHKTAKFIKSVLKEQGIEYKSIAGTGVLVKIEGSGDIENAIVLRADIDALPIQEKSDEKFASINDGVMHACGHDMHSAVLLGVITILNRNKERFRGTIFGLFQPGEEIRPGGASLVLKEKPFEGYSIKAFVGEHVDPELPAGVFGFRSGIYMASSDDFRITVKGKGGHAAIPHRVNDPVLAAAAIITTLQQVVSRAANPAVPSVLSVGRVIADGSTNVIPDSVYMEGTFRTFSEEWRVEAREKIETIIHSTSKSYGVESDLFIGEGYPCLVNDSSLISFAKEETAKMFGSEAVVELDLRTTSEDFGYYSQLYPSLYYRFGVGRRDGGSVGTLHTSTFAPNEDALEYAVAQMVNLALGLMK